MSICRIFFGYGRLGESVLDIVKFFDEHAPHWDSYQKKEEESIIRQILSRASLIRSDIVLDVACGTGVLVPFLEELGIDIQNITAIDIAPKMTEIFKQKFPDIKVINAAFEDFVFEPQSFSKILIFNAFPHFPKPGRVFQKAHQSLKPLGKLVIAHSLNREKLHQHHQKNPAVQSHRLLSDEEFLSHFRKFQFHEVVVENNDYFYAQGVKL